MLGDRGIARDRGPRAGSRSSPAVAVGNDCSGCSAPTRTPVPALEQRVEHIEPARSREVHHERAGLDRRLGRQQHLLDGAVGSGDDHERRAARDLGHERRARRRGTPRPRRRRRHRAHGPRRRRRSSPVRAARARSSSARRAEVRSGRRCALRSAMAECAMLPPPRARPPTTSPASTRAGRDVAQRRQHEPPLPHPRVRHVRSGVVEAHVVVQAARRRRASAGPSARRAPAARRASIRCASASSA